MSPTENVRSGYIFLFSNDLTISCDNSNNNAANGIVRIFFLWTIYWLLRCYMKSVWTLQIFSFDAESLFSPYQLTHRSRSVSRRDVIFDMIRMSIIFDLLHELFFSAHLFFKHIATLKK
jgi:hypothetical protein